MWAGTPEDLAATVSVAFKNNFCFRFQKENCLIFWFLPDSLIPTWLLPDSLIPTWQSEPCWVRPPSCSRRPPQGRGRFRRSWNHLSNAQPFNDIILWIQSLYIDDYWVAINCKMKSTQSFKSMTEVSRPLAINVSKVCPKIIADRMHTWEFFSTSEGLVRPTRSAIFCFNFFI